MKLVCTVRRSHSQFNSLFQSGTPVLYPGRPDRQTAVFRWLVTEVFCHRDRPIEVDMDKFQALVRAFRYIVIAVTDSNYWTVNIFRRNFVLIAHSPGSKRSRRLTQQFARRSDLCGAVDSTLIVASKVMQYVALFSELERKYYRSERIN